MPCFWNHLPVSLREIACKSPLGAFKRFSTGSAAFKHRFDAAQFIGAVLAILSQKRLAIRVKRNVVFTYIIEHLT